MYSSKLAIIICENVKFEILVQRYEKVIFVPLMYTYNNIILENMCNKNRTIKKDGTSICETNVGNNSIFVEELAFGHWGGFGEAAVVAFAAAALAGEHGLGAFLVLLELHVFLDGEGLSHGLNIKVVGTNERKGPVVLLQLLNHRANHFQRPLFRAVLLAVGNDGDEHVVAFFYLSVNLGDTLADGIVEGCATTGVVGFPVEILGARGWGVVVVPGGVAAVEGEEGDALLLVGVLLLHLTNSLEGLVHAYEGLLADDVHRTALIDDNQVVDTLCFFHVLLLGHGIIFLHNRNFLIGETSF